MYFTICSASPSFPSVSVFSVPSVVKSEKRNTEHTEDHRGPQRNPARAAAAECPSREPFSIELPPWWARGLLARLRRLWPLGMESALLVSADAFVRPESFEDE